MNITKIRSQLLLLALVAGSHALVAQNLLVNGSFENPSVPLPPFVVFLDPGSTFMPGWSVIGSGDVHLYATTAAQDGRQTLDLSGGTGTTAHGNAGIAQTFATVPGQSYELSFYHGSLAQTVSGPVFSVTINGQTYNFGETAGSVANPDWKRATIPFTASSVFSSLSFNNTTGFDSNDNVLDNISVTSVPEPAEWALLVGSCFVGITLSLHSRRR
ncbi:MAG TPA: DUF642 domain-containing protein [Candidatus Limnocylindria bacterium]|nr:DUF642 domain-containing protein [Candidatus Limnocylindria bacterium]